MTTPQPNEMVYAEHASDIIAKGAALIAASSAFALITSLEIEGGAARNVGSLALVDGAGAMTGYLSNGCIDRDIQLHAQKALQTKRKKLIRYGEGSRFADLKLPCGGALTVLIDPNPDIDAICAAAACFAKRKPARLTFHSPDDSGEGLSRTFTYDPRHRLVLAGRGAIFRSMAQIGSAIGYEVHLLSPDVADLSAVGHLSVSPPLHLTTPNTEHVFDILDAHSAFLTLFHDHEWEPHLLRSALTRPVGLIGSLGSRRTHDLRCETLRQMGVSDDSIARLRGPIGLVPSLRDASSIAVSALAEIVATFQSTDV
ncbi:MAG: XdhC family protein [Yoonia sp.]|nr:XdhC family protein [Yoonia sp.]